MTQEVQVLAYEQDSLLHRDYEQLEQNSECAFEGVDVTPLRAQKDEAELDATRRASIIADQAFAQVLPYIRPGVTERDISSRLESAMLLLGSEEKSFYTIVASGVRSSMPHGAASSKIIEKGDFITFDFGAVCDGYHSDMTRTIVVGKASREQRDFYSLVLEAQELGVASIRAGVSCREVDRLVRNFFSSRYVNQYFTHALGHGTGLEVHEAPILAPRATGPLKENMIVTVEPGLYIEGKYGVRIEDSVAVTAAGCEILTKTSKELMELS
jgi:Xaa-Pro aminopeptidase